MRPTVALWKQHIGRMTKFHWYIQGKKTVLKTDAEAILKEHGIPVADGTELLMKKKYPHQKFEVVGCYDKPIPMDENHPDYKAEECFIINDSNVLVEGLNQAKALTNTVELTTGLPKSLIDLEQSVSLSEQVHEQIKKGIMLSCLFEATQLKLPKRKDPARPAWNFPRDYGITDVHKNNLLCRNLLTMLERQGDRLADRCHISDAFVSVPLEAFDKKLQLEMTSELLITAAQPLPSHADPSQAGQLPLPDLFPLHPTLSIKPYNFYRHQHVFPITKSGSRWPYIHTAIVHYNGTQVGNEYDAPVSADQRQSRCLLKGFAMAVAQARDLYGSDVKGDLPSPVTVQVVQTDGREFHFIVFQLNTLNIEADLKEAPVRNILWNSPPLSLYKTCCYHQGRPVLENYNSHVFNRLLAFYNHG